jgi:hypothetical protein
MARQHLMALMNNVYLLNNAFTFQAMERLLAGRETNDFSPSLEIEPSRCCVVLRPRAQKQPPP